MTSSRTHSSVNVRYASRASLRWGRRLLVAGTVLLGVVAVTALAGAWRLSRGPVPLDLLRPRLERALSAEDGSTAARVLGPAAVWSGWGEPLEVRVDRVELVDAEQRPVVDLGQVSFDLAFKPLLRGELTPTGADVAALRIRLLRDEEGALALGFEPGVRATASGDPTAASWLLEEGLGPPDPSRPLGRLQRVRVADAEVTVEDRVLGLEWKVPHADLTVTRDGDSLRAEGSFDLVFGGRTTSASAEASFNPDTRELTVLASSKGLQPSALAQAHPRLQGFEGLDMPLDIALGILAAEGRGVRSVALDIGSEHGRVAVDAEWHGNGTITGQATLEDVKPWELAAVAPFLESAQMPLAGEIDFELDTTGNLDRAGFRLTLASGDLALPGLLPRPVRVSGGMVRGQVRDRLRLIEIDQATIDLGGPRLMARIAADRSGSDINAVVEAAVEAFPIDTLARFWPPAAAPETRSWIVQNLSQGTVREAGARLGLTVPGARLADTQLRSVEGRAEFEGMVVDYLSPMDEAVGVAGSCALRDGRLRLVVSDGRVRDQQVTRGDVTIDNVLGNRQWLAVDVDVEGPVRTALEMVTGGPFKIAASSLPPVERFTGTATTTVRLGIPLEENTRRRMTVSGSSHLRGLGLEDGPLGLDVSRGDLELSFNLARIDLAGDVLIDGVPTRLYWRERMGSRPVARSIRLRATLDSAGRSALGLPAVAAIDGPLPVELEISGLRNGRTEITADVDLGPSRVRVPVFGWQKPAGSPGRVRAHTSITRSGAVVLERVTVAAGDLEAEVSGLIEPGVGLRKLHLRKLHFAGTDLTGSASRTSAGALHVRIDARQLHIANIAAAVMAPRQGERSRPDQPIRVHARLENLTITRSPGLARVLQLGSAGGATGNHLLSFELLEGDFEYADDALAIAGGRAYTHSLGVAGRGSVDFATGTLDLSGAVVPVSHLQSLLGRIPGFEGSLTGVRDQGLNPVSFTVSGPMHDPEVNAVPTSTLTPENLRELFEGTGGGE